MEKAQMDALLAHGVKNGASDIHFKVGDRPAYRIDGQLRPVNCDPLMPPDTFAVCSTLLEPNVTPDELKKIQEYDSAYAIDGLARFRVNIYRQRGSLCCILRAIPGDVPTVEAMGLPATVRTLAEEERGLVLVTGATGSGKSTTLAAMVDHINRTRPVHILTIEDPIEYLHRHQTASISQREVGPDTSDFKTALRAALRQDPDVILVGEMRDIETIDIALKAAETGHMVFSTVHTTDAAKTVNRLIGVFPSEEQNRARIRLADALKGIISQRLLPRANGGGRVAACEILVGNATVRDTIKEGRDAALRELMEKGRAQYGMQTFDNHLIDLYKGGEITLEAAKAAATSPGDLMQELNFGDAAPAFEGAEQEAEPLLE
ncbi:MAG: PilT/PilU family type 4a pilus ATPase [Gemmatimonadetes bacterium]|nr:PilT/PilU family type 4a pilus ATPase [Gemmatimonadota bacterium]